MDAPRRAFLQNVAQGAGVLLIGGVAVGARFARQSHARDALRQQLSNDSTRLLVRKSGPELDELPEAARQEFRDYFHGVCLNVHAFVSEVCSEAFAVRINACKSENEKHGLLNVLFSQKVITAIEVANRVEIVAQETGRELDRNWDQLCTDLGVVWRRSLEARRSEMLANDLARRLDPLIRRGLNDAKDAVYPAAQRPSIVQTATGIGQAALLLLPASIGPPMIAYPIVVLTALKRLWDWIIGWMNASVANYQMAVSERLAELGNRIAVEFQQEFRSRIADLQKWQENALDVAAREMADESIPSLF